MKHIRRIITSLLIVVLFALLCELGLRMVAGSIAVAASDPALLAYAHSPYYGTMFQAEVHEASTRVDFHGKWINVTNGRRATTDQPIHAKHTIWLFGSSTMRSLNTPDSMTIPSYLQRRLGGSYRIENMGQDSANVYGELLALEDAAVKPGDVIIFYDGAVDAATPYVRALLDYQSSALCWRTASLNFTALYHVLCGYDLYDVPSFAPDTTALVADYERGIGKAHAWATIHGATFYHFLQPHIWSRSLSVYERQVAAKWHHDGQLEQSVLAMYALMRIDSRTIDLTHVLDRLRADGTEVYLDGFHVTEQGNQAVADALFQVLVL